MVHCPRPRLSRSIVVCLALVAACAAPRDDKALVNLLEHEGICLADFDNGLAFESDLLSVFWHGFPSEKEFAAHRDVGDFTSFAWIEEERFSDPVLLMDGTRGDFLQARVLTGPFSEDGQEKRVVYGCLLTLRSNATGPDAPTVEAELARLGVTLGKPFAYWRGLGVFQETSTPQVYALVESMPDGPRITSLFRSAHETIPFLNGACLRIADIESKAGERLDPRRNYNHEHWRWVYEDAAAAGIAEAARALANLATTNAAEMQAAIAASAECPADAPAATRCKAVAVLAAKVAALGPSDPAANEALRAEHAKLAETLQRAANATRESGDGFEADLLDWVAARPLGEDASANAKELEGRAWALEWIATVHGTSPFDRLRLHAELRKADISHGMAEDFRTAARIALADSFVRSAKEASAKQLHATAAGDFLIADSLTQTRRPGPETVGILRIVGAEGTPEDPHAPLHRARVEGVALLARALPFVGECNETYYSWGKETGVHDFANVLYDMPLADPRALGIDVRSGEDQIHFAQNADLLAPGVSVPLLKVTMSPPTLTDVKLTTDKEVRTGKVVTESVQSNDAAVAEWIAEVNSLVSRIDSLDESIAAARGESVRVTDTDTWSSVTHGATHTYTMTATHESMSSAIARVQAMGRVEQLSAERDRLESRLRYLHERQPSGSSVRFSTNEVRCEVEYQHWALTFKDTVLIEGGPQPITVTVESKATRHLARNPASPALGIEAVDEWITEEQLREKPPIAKDWTRTLVEIALRQYLAYRVEGLRAEIGKRELTEAERASELAWLAYFTTQDWKPDDPESKGLGRVIALARSHW